MKRCLTLSGARSALCALLCLTPSAVFAQGAEGSTKELVELTPTQIDTNNQAVRLLSETPPRTKEAIKLVEAALLMENKGDLLYLTLGRAYQLDGQCEMAASQFDQAARAPGVQGVPEGFVAGQLAQYREELEVCKGSLLIECEPGDLELQLNGAALTCGEVTALEPGTYAVAVKNTYTNDELTLPVQISGGKQTTSQVKLGKARPARGADGAQGTEPQVIAPAPVAVQWRLAPYAAMSSIDFVAEQGAGAPPDKDLSPYYFQSRVIVPSIGIEGRALWGSDSLRYGVGIDARAGVGLRSSTTSEQMGEPLWYDRGARIGFSGQMWWNARWGLYVNGVTRPTALTKDFHEFSLSGGALGGGLRAELGGLLGIPGLELHAGALIPLSGESTSTTSNTSSVTILPIDIGARVQPFKGLTIGAQFEGWFAEGDRRTDNDPGQAFPPPQDKEFAPKANIRAQQFTLTLGWTFGR